MALAVVLLACISVAYAGISIINEYDANGNLVTSDGKYCEYNDAIQLVRVRQSCRGMDNVSQPC